MNELLPKELKEYIESNQDALVKLLDTLCRIPSPSNHEELRAEFVKDWFEKEKRKKLRSEKVDNYVNALCDRAIARAKRKMLLNTAEA